VSLGAHWVQAHGESFILLVGNKVDFGAEELSNQGAGIVEPFDLFAGKLREGCFSPISDELDSVDEQREVPEFLRFQRYRSIPAGAPRALRVPDR
jgi:hypothetical protein